MSENFKKPDALTEWMGDLDEVRPDDWDVQSRSLADALQNNINYFNNFPLDKYLKFFPDYNPTDAELNAINADGGQGSVRIDVKMGVEVEWSMQGTEQEYFSDVDRQKVKERISALETENIHPYTSSERV